MQFDADGNPIPIQDPSQVNPALSPQPQSQATTSPYGNPGAAPALANTDRWNITDTNTADQNLIAAGAQQIGNEAGSELNYYGPRQTQQTGLADQAIANLGAAPGYTPGQAAQINTNYSQYNTSPDALSSEYLTPTEQQGTFGDPSVGAKVTDQGIANEGAQLNAYGQDLSGQVSNFANYTGQGVTNLDTGLATANTGLQTGLQGAQGKFSSLDSAVNNPGLAFDPNSTEKQITDAQVQEMKTAAGQRIGNQYQTAEDTLARNAAAAGNSSPLAIAAANARLQSQEASDQGNAETNADIAARQAQEQQAAAIEAQREASVNAQTGFKAGAATTEQSQAQQAAALAGTTAVNSAGLAGTQGLAAAEATGQAGINAANQYGSAAIGEQNTMTGQQYNADTTAEQESAARAAAIAGNRQATDTSINNTGYSQGTGSAQMTAGGAAKVGDAQIASKNQYISDTTGQEAAAQQGGQAAVGQQGSALQTETSGLTSNQAVQAGYKTNSPTVFGQVVQGITALAGGANQGAQAYKAVSAKGDVVTKPEVHMIAERGPEVVMPVGPGRYRPQRGVAA